MSDGSSRLVWLVELRRLQDSLGLRLHFQCGTSYTPFSLMWIFALANSEMTQAEGCGSQEPRWSFTSETSDVYTWCKPYRKIKGLQLETNFRTHFWLHPCHRYVKHFVRRFGADRISPFFYSYFTFRPVERSWVGAGANLLQTTWQRRTTYGFPLPWKKIKTFKAHGNNYLWKVGQFLQDVRQKKKKRAWGFNRTINVTLINIKWYEL